MSELHHSLHLSVRLAIFFARALRLAPRTLNATRGMARTLVSQCNAAVRRAWWFRKGIVVPPMLIVSITHRCNLQCANCYSRALHKDKSGELSARELTRLFDEARGLGSRFVIVAGGEPLLREDLVDVLARFPDIIFLVFTNGTLLTEDLARRMAAPGNIVPVLSLEGRQQQTDGRRGEGVFAHLDRTMASLRRHKVFFGASFTVTKSNLDTVLEPDFVESMVAGGTRMFFYLELTPVGGDCGGEVLEEEARERLKAATARFQKKLSALFVAVPGDEELFGGCLAAGRGFVHISPEGAVEACPFAPFSEKALGEGGLREALDSRFFAALRAQPEWLEEGPGGCTLWQHGDKVQGLLREIEEQK